MAPPPQRATVPPVTDADSEPWWQGVREGRLLLQRCDACGRCRFPPLPDCPYCGAAGHRVETASGRGRIYSWITVNRALSERFAGQEPYTVVTVDLDEGGRIFGRLLEGAAVPDGRVEAVFYSVDDVALVGFRAVDE